MLVVNFAGLCSNTHYILLNLLFNSRKRPNSTPKIARPDTSEEMKVGSDWPLLR